MIFYVIGWTWLLRSILVVSLHMADEEVAVLVVNSGSGLRSTGFACDAPRAAFP